MSIALHTSSKMATAIWGFHMVPTMIMSLILHLFEKQTHCLRRLVVPGPHEDPKHKKKLETSSTITPKTPIISPPPPAFRYLLFEQILVIWSRWTWANIPTSVTWKMVQSSATTHQIDTRQGINISHLGKRKIIFKMRFLGDMLVPWRVPSWWFQLPEIRPAISGLIKGNEWVSIGLDNKAGLGGASWLTINISQIGSFPFIMAYCNPHITW